MNDLSYVYIMSCKSRNVLYVGVTSDLEKRVGEHKNHAFPNSFSSRYNCVDLVYYETCLSIEQAILREKVIKSWSRAKKDELIATQNPTLKDLSLPAGF